MVAVDNFTSSNKVSTGERNMNGITKAFVVAGMGLAMLAFAVSAQASFTQLTNTSQFDVTGIATNPNHTPVTGYALDLGSNAPNGVLFNGVLFRPCSKGYASNMVDGVTTIANPYEDLTWDMIGVGPRSTPAGTDGAALKTMMEDWNWVSTFGFAVTQGQQYKLQIIGSAPAGNPNGGAFVIKADGIAEICARANDGTNWIYTTTFTASSNNVAIQMGTAAGDVPEAGALLLTPVPEPATMSLLAIGGLSALIRRRK